MISQQMVLHSASSAIKAIGRSTLYSGYLVTFHVSEAMTMRGKRRRTNKRSWDEMPPEVLVEIFVRVPIGSMFYFTYGVCKSWCSAVLDIIFPSPGLLDLNKVVAYPRHLHKEYLRFLKILLDTRPNAQWHTLVLPPFTVRLKEHAIVYIAQRTPCLKFLHSNKIGLELDSYLKAFPYWKNLEAYSCPLNPMSRGIYSLTRSLGNYCKNLQHLDLRWTFGSETTSLIVKHLLQLESLSLKKSSLTLDALLIFDGHGKLRILDLKHCLFVDAEVLAHFFHRPGVKGWLLDKPGIKAKKWNEEIHEKVSGNKRYIHCEEALCHECSWAY